MAGSRRGIYEANYSGRGGKTVFPSHIWHETLIETLSNTSNKQLEHGQTLYTKPSVLGMKGKT